MPQYKVKVWEKCKYTLLIEGDNKEQVKQFIADEDVLNKETLKDCTITKFEIKEY